MAAALCAHGTLAEIALRSVAEIAALTAMDESEELSRRDRRSEADSPDGETPLVRTCRCQPSWRVASLQRG